MWFKIEVRMSPGPITINSSIRITRTILMGNQVDPTTTLGMVEAAIVNPLIKFVVSIATLIFFVIIDLIKNFQALLSTP